MSIPQGCLRGAGHGPHQCNHRRVLCCGMCAWPDSRGHLCRRGSGRAGRAFRDPSQVPTLRSGRGGWFGNSRIAFQPDRGHNAFASNPLNSDFESIDLPCIFRRTCWPFPAKVGATSPPVASLPLAGPESIVLSNRALDVWSSAHDSPLTSVFCQ